MQTRFFVPVFARNRVRVLRYAALALCVALVGCSSGSSNSGTPFQSAVSGTIFSASR